MAWVCGNRQKFNELAIRKYKLYLETERKGIGEAKKSG